MSKFLEFYRINKLKKQNKSFQKWFAAIFGETFYYSDNENGEYISVSHDNSYVNAEWKLTDHGVELKINHFDSGVLIHNFTDIKTFNAWLDKQLEKMK